MARVHAVRAVERVDQLIGEIRRHDADSMVVLQPERPRSRPTAAITPACVPINQVVKERVNHLLEASMALEQVTFETADHREATTAFKERRTPVFQ